MNDIRTYLIDKMVEIQRDKNYKFNARMSGKNWCLINRLTDAIQNYLKNNLTQGQHRYIVQNGIRYIHENDIKKIWR